MIHGEYILKHAGEELILPNNFTIFGVALLLKAAMWNVRPTLYMGLCAVNPADNLQLGSIQEPAVANGYARQAIPMDQVNWPKFGSINGEIYVESREVTFPISDDTSTAVNRLFLTEGTQVISVSSAFPEGLEFKSTPYTNRYRFYVR